jgi:uncharacterized SAM-binding protein YcdF (DUF218 family)
VPPEAILTEPYSRITHENLAYSAEIAEARGVRTFLIVSDPLHMRRAMRMAADLDLDARPAATPSTRHTSLRSRLWFLRRETFFYLQHVLVTRFLPVREMD